MGFYQFFLQIGIQIAPRCIPYARHYKPRLVSFLPHFSLRVILHIERLVLQTVNVLKKGNFSIFGPKTPGLELRAVSDQERVIMARVWSPLTPDRRQVERPPPLLQSTSNFLVFDGLSHGTTFKKKGVAVF